jgi:hypothetical protein
MTVPARMRGFMLCGWRWSMDRLANHSMNKCGRALLSNFRIAIRKAAKWPDQTLVTAMAWYDIL